MASLLVRNAAIARVRTSCALCWRPTFDAFPFCLCHVTLLSALYLQNDDGVDNFVPWVHLNKNLQSDPLQIFAQLKDLSVVSSSPVFHYMHKVYVRGRVLSAGPSHFSPRSAHPISVS